MAITTQRSIMAVRWIGLLVWVALISVFYLRTPSTGNDSNPVGHPTPTHILDRISPITQLDEPPRVAPPDAESVRQLGEVAHRIGRAVMLVGHPKAGGGTAFVISRRERLLITNAHVASIQREAGEMVAIGNGSKQIYRVAQVWYHPDYERAIAEGVRVHAGNRTGVYRGGLGPDLAILKLAPEGPDLPAECVLVDRGEKTRPGSPVGVLGFSGPLPPDGESMTAGFKSGAISSLTEFVASWDDSLRWSLIDTTAIIDTGDSGGPVFRPDGRVVAVCAWMRSPKHDAEVESESSAACIGADDVWQLLGHHGLMHLVEATHSR